MQSYTGLLWPATAPTPPQPARLGVVEGEGIGPEVIGAALTVLAAAASAYDCPIEVTAGPATTGRPDVEQLATWYDEQFGTGIPILHGPVGGRFVYDLRRRYDLFAKLVPVRPDEALRDASIVRPERLDGADVLIARDNIDGLYQGGFGWRDDGDTAFQESAYRRADVDRLMELAARVARERTGRLAVVLKPGGIPTISALWRQSAERLASDLRTEFIEIDNACFQLIADPARFDVVAAPNMVGDVVGDTAALLLGSRGMSYSANFGAQGHAVYQTAHGAAHDLAGQGVANPSGQILTLAWLLRDSLGLAGPAAAIERALHDTLAAGLRTADIAGPTSTVLGTQALAEAVAERIQAP